MTQRFILLFLGVFVRKKKNKNGVISIQVIAKVNGKSKLLKTIRSSPDLQAIEKFVNKENIDLFVGPHWKFLLLFSI